MFAKRGVLIVLEGCDKAGKSTHSKMLFEAMSKLGKQVYHMRFPERSTGIGQMIDKYLKYQTDHQDQVIHLLFSANRWELVPKIKQLLYSGQSVIIDRYAFSGAAFTSAKGISLEWCKGSDVGLPKPDIVIFLNVTKEEASIRTGYGEERYENLEFQEKVKNKYEQLMGDYWKIVQTGQPIEKVHEEILSYALNILEKNEGLPLDNLWE